MATFLVLFKMLPDQFYSLTGYEYQAIVDAHKRLNRNR